ncbi:MAG: hypothetical protein PWQ96_243 [Clostridia bacterium]|jgi:hypothetical protein|nr:hypothetical protein [Clostridiales bacterium]MDK2984601.1 hypothetical protein [Clostridia bacterium]
MEKKHTQIILHGQCYADEDMKEPVTCEECLNYQCILHPQHDEEIENEDLLKVG